MHVFWGMKKLVQLKFVQLLLLNRVKARWSENRAAQGFHFINSFISNYFGPNSQTCTCEVRAAQGRVSRGLTVSNSMKDSDFACGQKTGTVQIAVVPQWDQIFFLKFQCHRNCFLSHFNKYMFLTFPPERFTSRKDLVKLHWYAQSCSISKKTFDLTVTRGTLWSNKV